MREPVELTLGRCRVQVTPLSSLVATALPDESTCGDLVGHSAAMSGLFDKLKKAAATDATVLITGETGTGKELVAQALHELGPRRGKPFVVVDCGALPQSLIESELFGHERGAFTGADQRRLGTFESADGGSIFLDEIGELPLALQPTLLGVLQRKEARRVGSSHAVAFDVRVIAATNRDLPTEINKRAFRADLYYRLALIELRVPPLRDRTEDVPLLAEHFRRALGGDRRAIAQEELEHLCSYPWPGNVRELRNVVERALMLDEPMAPGSWQRPVAVPEERPLDLETLIDLERPLHAQRDALAGAFEHAYVERMIQATSGNVAKAARRAGIDRASLYKLLGRYQIESRR